MVRWLINILGLAVTWMVWFCLVITPLPPSQNLLITVGGTLLIIPFVFAGRFLLDRQPDQKRAERVTIIFHYLIAIMLGSAVITGTRLGQTATRSPFPLPAWTGLLVMLMSGTALALIVLNLTVKGLGSPFALALTRLVATDWAYAWTRNPMVLSALAFLVGLGLWLNSALFLVWVLVVLSPVIWIYLHVYEERELEIRFGQPYLEYKAKTSALLPRKPTDKPTS